MQIISFKYREFWDHPHAWEVTEFSLSPMNLIVGRNASGKTRVINTIAFLAQFLRTGVISSWNSGDWEVKFLHNSDIYCIRLTIELEKVSYEEIFVNNTLVLRRDADGSGKIFFQEIGDFVDFRIASESIASVMKRDSLQHPFLEPIFEWSNSMRLYQFSTDMGRQAIHMVSASDGNPDNAEMVPKPAVKNGSAVVAQYVAGYSHFGDDFDKSILHDLSAIGYNSTAINATPVPNVPYVDGNLPVMLQLKEADLNTPTEQHEMSTGMFRALAVIIHINYVLMSKSSTTIIIDDIGEGLDFERSKKLINLLIDRCQNKPIQLILTSNDRFVMNEVDIDLWHILERTSSRVTVFDKENSGDQFENFRLSGLSNFDFFSMGISGRAQLQ